MFLLIPFRLVFSPRIFPNLELGNVEPFYRLASVRILKFPASLQLYHRQADRATFPLLVRMHHHTFL